LVVVADMVAVDPTAGQQVVVVVVVADLVGCLWWWLIWRLLIQLKAS